MTIAAVKKVGMIILMEKDLAKAVEFYKSLGLKLKFHLKDRWAEFELDNVKIGLCPTDEDFGLIRSGIVLEVEDLRAFFEANKGSMEFFGEPHEAVHGIMISFKDPSGNVLDLYQPTPEKVRDLIKKNAQDEGNDSCCKPSGSEDAGCCDSEEESEDCNSDACC
jgi:catechol 2,3-dioxygenase-like lactoylglutathione lyase family enzyme